MRTKFAALAIVSMLGSGAFAFTARVWRGETAYFELPENEAKAVGAAGCIAKDGVCVTPGRYDEVAYELKPKGVDMRSRPDVWRTARQGDAKAPSACKIEVAADAKPGKRNFGPLEIEVLPRVLPPPREWKYFLDLWQHPWAVARYFDVEPFSSEHYARMRTVWSTLADFGVKTITVSILDLPWNHQCYDGYHSMIDRVKAGDGSWKFDYTLFDRYVEFARSCGLGPDIACYTMCPWGYMASWRDAAGQTHREKLLPGTPQFEEYWGAFLVDFSAHLKAKGWFANAYMAMDERSPEDVRAIVALIQAKAPGLKVAMAGNKSPAAFDGIKIDNYSQGLHHLGKSPDFLKTLDARRAQGCKTTVYVCCSPQRPNNFMLSSDDEGFWLGVYPAMAGFDGFLRWAANSWPADPYKDASFKTKSWKAGDTFLVYPNGEPSARLVALRAGIVAAEKLRILGPAAKAKADEIAGRCGYAAALKGKVDMGAFRREVEALVNAD